MVKLLIIEYVCCVRMGLREIYKEQGYTHTIGIRLKQGL